MNIEQKVLISVRKRSGKVILSKDLAALGSPASVSRALSALTRKGVLIRLGYGVYAKTRINRITQKPAPDGWFYDLASEALDRLGVEVEPGQATRLYNAGSTQVPAVFSVSTPRRRITRQLQFGNQRLVYE